MARESSTHLPRIAVGGIVHETHSFADDLTGLTDFVEQSLHTGEALLRELGDTRAAIGGMIAGARSQGWTLVPTLYGAAMPSGTVADTAYRSMVTALADALAGAGAVDGVLLALHGAMVTETVSDPESDVLEAVRTVVGADTPIVVVLDMHGNISPRMVELADVLVAFDTNPHVDPHARGLEAVDILAALLAERVKPVAAIAQPPQIFAPQATGTDDLPFRAVHARRIEMEQDPDVVCISVMAGFAYADTPDTGPAMIVTTDNNWQKAQAYAHELAQILMEHAAEAALTLLSPDEAVRRALATTQDSIAERVNGPAILVDSADNIGGGTPGDGTDALRAMLDAGVQEGTIVLADPEAVAICWQAGQGCEVSVAVGGKADSWHGEPVQVVGKVQALSDGAFECELPDNHFASFFGNTIHMGRTVWLRVDGVNIILTERKIPPFDLAQLRGVGVQPEAQAMIVVKSAVAYRAAYLPIASQVLEMDTRGLCTMNLARFPYKHAVRNL